MKKDTVDTTNPINNEKWKKYKMKKGTARETANRSDLENNNMNGVLSLINNKVIIV